MNGNRDNECVTEIKRIVRMQHVPLIVYTTGAHPQTVGNALELGIYKYVIKPNYHAETVQKLSEIFSEVETLPR